MNKKDYIDAINEIKADDKLKNKTIQKLTAPKTKTYAFPKRILSAAAVFILLFSVIVANNNIKNTNQPGNITTAKLPTVGSYENMKKIIEKNKEYNTNRTNGDLVFEDMAVNSPSMETTNKTNQSTSQYSTTNVQVQGVDEADIVKTNGEYIFYYRKSERALSIVDVKNEEVVETIEYEEAIPNSIYLNGDKLVVIATKREETEKSRYKYYTYRSMLNVIEYNIADIDDIKVEREMEVEGNLVTSRMIGENVYIVSNKYIYTNMLENEEMLKPIYSDTAVGEETKCIEYNEIQYFPDTIATNYMIVSSFNISNKEEVNVQTYLGNADNVYASTNNLYVICRQYTTVKEFMGIDYASYENSTKVYKFGLDNGDINYVADGAVPGEVEDQFSMDEYNGYFRIATTHNSKETLYKDVNNLYVLDDKLNLVGQIENLAPGESIYSVRYMGEKAYMVTFEQVDPLFVIDLSNPTEPKVLGKLKIPGYSDYLHPYDETHIIGFGKDTEDKGDFVTTKGFKMALFDVSDVKNPKELYSVKIGDSGTYSELLSNHKALLFSKENNIIAFPITVREKQNGSDYYTKTTLRGAVIYGLSLEEGFEERAKIEHGDDAYAIERIIYIGDKIYTLSQDLITIIDMDTMEEKGKIKL